MGKAEMCIRMLQILNTGRVYKISELAALLDTNPRNIIEYKKELDEVSGSCEGGFYIDTIPGRNGGYKLNGNAVIPALKLLKNEKEALVEGYEYLLNKADFMKKEDATRAFAKVLSNIQFDKEEQEKLIVVDKYQLTMDEKDIKERYDFIEDAIKQKRVIEIEYMSLKNGFKKHILHPYKLIIYNNSWFFLALNPEEGEVWSFKVNRVINYKMLDKKFTVWKGFKAEDYFDGQGFVNNGQYEHVEFIATGTRAFLMRERQYGKNQVIEELEDGSIKVSVDMQNKVQILSFALGCGSEIEVLSPEWLKDEIKQVALEIIDKYDGK